MSEKIRFENDLISFNFGDTQELSGVLTVEEREQLKRGLAKEAHSGH